MACGKDMGSTEAPATRIDILLDDINAEVVKLTCERDTALSEVVQAESQRDAAEKERDELKRLNAQIEAGCGDLLAKFKKGIAAYIALLVAMLAFGFSLGWFVKWSIVK